MLPCQREDMNGSKLPNASEPVVNMATHHSLDGGLERTAQGASAFAAWQEWYPWVIAVAVFFSRALTTGGVYWQDGPYHLREIQSGTYLIQAPGYWLWNRAGGLFLNPELGLDLMNWFFSAAAIPVFYGVARALVEKGIARIATALFASVFFVWFSGNMQSTYPSQLFFPCAVAFLFLMRHQTGNRVFLWIAAIAYSTGTGFRPSDGLLLAPVMAWWLWQEDRRDIAVASLLIMGSALAWVIPTLIAMHELRPEGGSGGIAGAATYTQSILGVASAFSGNRVRWTGNVARVAVPLGVAFWPIAIPLVRGLSRLSRRTMFLLVWLLPSLAFFALFYMSTAPYLNVIVAPVILIAAIGASGLASRLSIAICVAWNIAFYTLFTPPSSGGTAGKALSAMAGVYTYYGVRHRWAPNFSELVGSPGGAPPVPPLRTQP